MSVLARAWLLADSRGLIGNAEGKFRKRVAHLVQILWLQQAGRAQRHHGPLGESPGSWHRSRPALARSYGRLTEASVGRWELSRHGLPACVGLGDGSPDPIAE